MYRMGAALIAYSLECELPQSENLPFDKGKTKHQHSTNTAVGRKKSQKEKKNSAIHFSRHRYTQKWKTIEWTGGIKWTSEMWEREQENVLKAKTWVLPLVRFIVLSAEHISIQSFVFQPFASCYFCLFRILLDSPFFPQFILFLTMIIIIICVCVCLNVLYCLSVFRANMSISYNEKGSFYMWMGTSTLTGTLGQTQTHLANSFKTNYPPVHHWMNKELAQRVEDEDWYWRERFIHHHSSSSSRISSLTLTVPAAICTATFTERKMITSECEKRRKKWLQLTAVLTGKKWWLWWWQK